MQIDDLSEEEITLIQKHREAVTAKNEANYFRRKAISAAYEFEEWSMHSDQGLTFSTFVNSFGYQDRDCREIYEAVKRINAAAWPVGSIKQIPTKEVFFMQEDISTLNPGDRFVKVLELLDGLSTKEISCLLANIQNTVRDKGTVKIEGVRPEQYNSDLRGTF